MRILLPSHVTRALEGLGDVLGAADLHEYLEEADAAVLERARRVLGELRATAIQACDDPQHELDQVTRALTRLSELTEARGRAAGPLAQAQVAMDQEVVPWDRSNASDRTGWTSVGGGSFGHPGPCAPWRSMGMWSPC